MLKTKQIVNKTKKILFLVLTLFLIVVTYKVAIVLKSFQCEKNVFSNPVYQGGSEFKILYKKCMQEKKLFYMLYNQ